MTTAISDLDTRKGHTAIDWRSLVSPTVTILGALLLIQLLAALILGLSGRDMAPAGTQGTLLTFNDGQVTRIRIEVPNGDGVLVSKTEEGWVVPALGDLPAAQAKVSDLLSKLGELEKGLPVATSEAASKRFKVAEDVFERKLTLESGSDALATLYLGDSPGFRRLFVRAEGEDAVYEAQLGLFDVPEAPDTWSDRSLLYLDKDGIQELSIGGLTLERKDGDWRLTDLAEGEEQDTGAIADLIRLLTRIDFVGVLDAETESAIDQDVPPLDIQAVLKSGDIVDYRITKRDQDNDYLLEASNRPQRFKLPAYAAEELAGVERAGLLMESEQTAETPPGTTPSENSTNTDNATADGADVSPPVSSEKVTETDPPRMATQAAPPETETVTPEGTIQQPKERY